MLDQLRQNPGDNRAVLELFYLVLSLGFEGKYRLMPGAASRWNLYAMICTHPFAPSAESMSAAWRALGRAWAAPAALLSHYLPTWVAASVVAALVFFGYVGFKLWLNASSEPTLEP